MERQIFFYTLHPSFPKSFLNQSVMFGCRWRRLYAIFFLFILIATGKTSSALDLSNCQVALGMQNGEIPDVSLTASSSIEPIRRGPTKARIRLEKGDGAWCPKQQISSNAYEYLEIDLGLLKVITLVETQGRFGNGQGTEYTDQYRLEYQRELDGTWFRFKNRRGQEIFPGNSNTYMTEMREVQPAIIALKIRFVPVSTHPRTVCLRVELYGCPWTDGVVSYDMPQGNRFGSDLDLFDLSYDGDASTDGHLHGGLGQLTDSEEGHSNFRMDPVEMANKGFRWVGWKNDSFSGRPLSIVFTFDAVRNFTSLTLHCNNMFSKGVRVFRSARIYFGNVGTGEEGDFSGGTVEYGYARDSQNEFARTLRIGLGNGVGMLVRLDLFFDDKWIMISEVHFESDYVRQDLNPDLQTKNNSSLIRSTIKSNPSDHLMEIPFPVHYSPDTSKNDDLIITGSSLNSTTTAQTAVLYKQKNLRNGLDYGSVITMIVVLALLLLVLCSVILLIFYKRHKHKATKSSAILTNQSSASISRPSSLLYPTAYLINNGSSHRPSYPVPLYGHGPANPSDLLDQPPNLTVSPYATIDVPVGMREMPVNNEDSTVDGGYSNTLDLLPLSSFSLSVIDLPRSCLNYVRSLGEGNFGQVFICEVSNGQSVTKNHVLQENSLPVVAVKVLRHNASDVQRSVFEREVRKFLRLKDPNIVSMLTVYLDEEPHCIVLEYPKFGDLRSFLQQKVNEESQFDSDESPPTFDSISYGCLIFMASQIASGMKYFEANNLVHRDLAARNCLVGDDYTVKISDLGTSHNDYPHDYSAVAGPTPLPIRWMAWESILLGRFGIKSDVWSFGVTVWEILTVGQSVPYETLTDHQVMDNCHNIYCENSGEIWLDRPVRCPREIYDLLRHCWTRDDSQRPSFHEVHMFLQRKNAGYSPPNEKHSVSSLGQTHAFETFFV